MRSFFNTCAWCDNEVPENSEAYAINAAVKYKNVLEGHEGTFIPFPLTLAHKTVYGCVVTSDSDAKKEGVNMVFMACCLECASALKAALSDESGIDKIYH